MNPYAPTVADIEALKRRIEALEQGQRMNDEWHTAEAEVRSNFSHRIASLEERQYGHQCACGDAHVDTCQSCPPAPTPEWRRLVDVFSDESQGYATPLADVLAHLCDVEHAASRGREDDVRFSLARIVAIAESQAQTTVTISGASPDESLCVEGLVTSMCGPLPDGTYGTPRIGTGESVRPCKPCGVSPMCDCECCRTRCSSTYDRPKWGLPGWCGCTCGNCIAVYASEAYDAGRKSLRGESDE